MSKPLDVISGPLVWIDCEMTGLDARTDTILEIAVGASTVKLRQLMQFSIGYHH